MAYGKEPLRPGKKSAEIKPAPQPLTKKVQQAEPEYFGADMRDFGQMPKTGNFQPNAGMSGGSKGGHSVQGEMKGAGGKGRSAAGPQDRGPGVSHTSQKEPVAPGSSGGNQTGSLDTLTSLFFHPKGGMGKGKTAKAPQRSGRFKDSGERQESARKDAGAAGG